MAQPGLSDSSAPPNLNLIDCVGFSLVISKSVIVLNEMKEK